ncbi:MAG TPA: EpsG family protein [Gallicola sp.]|nr:EpsG family protein [Gallicola sp.]
MFGLLNYVLSTLKNPYYSNIISLFLFAIVILKNKNIQNRHSVFISIASINWILISSLRHISVGGRDVYVSYLSRFVQSRNITWVDAFTSFYQGIFYGESIKDPGYLIFEKLISSWTGSYRVYLAIIAVFFMVPFARYVKKNSRDPFISFLIYSTLFYSFFSITGFRQTIATALIVLIGFEFIKEKKILKFMIVAAIAFTIHKSAIVFLPFYFIANVKLTKKTTIIYLSIGVVFWLFGDFVISPIANYLGYGYMLENEVTGTTTFTLMMVLISVATLMRTRKILSINPQAQAFIHGTYIGTILSIMTLQNQSFMRIQLYFSIFIVLQIPEILMSFDKRTKIIVYYFVLSILMLLFLRTNPRYLFFWEGG